MALKNGQSRDTGNIGYTRHMIKRNKTKTQHRKQNGQSRDTGNIGYTRHMIKRNKTKNNKEPTTQHRKLK